VDCPGRWGSAPGAAADAVRVATRLAQLGDALVDPAVLAERGEEGQAHAVALPRPLEVEQPRLAASSSGSWGGVGGGAQVAPQLRQGPLGPPARRHLLCWSGRTEPWRGLVRRVLLASLASRIVRDFQSAPGGVGSGGGAALARHGQPSRDAFSRSPLHRVAPARATHSPALATLCGPAAGRAAQASNPWPRWGRQGGGARAAAAASG